MIILAGPSCAGKSFAINDLGLTEDKRVTAERRGYLLMSKQICHWCTDLSAREPDCNLKNFNMVDKVILYFPPYEMYHNRCLSRNVWKMLTDHSYHFNCYDWTVWFCERVDSDKVTVVTNLEDVREIVNGHYSSN